VGLGELYEQYHDRVRFLSIYIREAHPIDGWWMGFRLTRWMVERYSPQAALDVYDPQTMEERRAVAGRCETALQYGIHTYVDETDDRDSQAYAAWPTRLLLIGGDGRVVYRGGLGPYGFKPAELKGAIEAYLAAQNEMPAS